MQSILTQAEFQLAAECCRWRYSGEGAERLSSLARNVDWPRFLRLIERHRVETLAGAALKANEIEPPAAVNETISRRLLEIARENLRSAQDCRLINQ